MKARYLLPGFALLLLVLITGVFLRNRPDGDREVRQHPIEFAELGKTQVFQGGEAGFVLLLSDEKSMPEARAAANALARAGQVAALIDTDGYFREVAHQQAECLDSVTLLDVYVQQVQQQVRFGKAIKPALLGIGAGAAYVPLILQQARAGIFAAGISVNPPVTLALPAAPCGEVASAVAWSAADKPVPTPHPASTATPWQVLPDWHQAVEALQQADAANGGSSADQGLATLPLIELPAAQGSQSPFLVIILSGDGGWANIDKDIGEALVSRNIPVVGWNSLKYFWQKQTPDVMARDLDHVISHYRQAWNKPQVLLVGFSLGADVLPFMVNRLSPDSRSAVAGMVLLSPSMTADFQFQVTDWVENSTSEDDQPLAPEMDRLQSLPLLCVYGTDDDEGICPSLQGRAQSQVVSLPGDHHYDGDYDAVTDLILKRFYPDAPR